MVTPIAIRFGWRAAFLFTGFLGAAWIVWWSRLSRGIGNKHESASSGITRAASSSPRWSDPRLWAFILIYALGALPTGFVLYEAANYLGQARGQTQAFIGMVLWIPPLGWEIGYFVWGWLYDSAIRSGTSTMAALRRLMGVATALSLPLFVVP